MAEKKFDAGGMIYREGDVTDFAYYVVSGKVEIYEVTREAESRIRVVEQGLTFGEFALFDPEQLRPFNARAIEPTVLVSMGLEEFKTLLDQCPKQILPFLTLAFEKMKATRVKEKASVTQVLEGDIKKVTISPNSEKMKALFKPIDVPISTLPFRIGGYPEGGEINRRDQLHLYIAAQANPLKISRQHCEITVENKSLALVDLGSRFGTTVNGITIGRGRGTYTAFLKKGVNEVSLGEASDPYKFTVKCE